FIVGGLAEIAGIAVKHACNMIVARAAGADSNRLLACSHGIVVATLKQARITQRRVSLIAVRVDRHSTSRALQGRFVGCRLVLFPAKASLVGQCHPQQTKRRRKGRVDRQGPFELAARLRMSMPGEVDIEESRFVEVLIYQRAARTFAPDPRIFAKRQPNLERGDDVLRYPVLKLEHVVEVALETVCPHMAAVQAVDQLSRQSHTIASLANAPFQHIASAELSPDFANVLVCPLNTKLESRAMTISSWIFDKVVSTSSAIPSAKYSCSGSPDMFLNECTAMEGLSGNGGALSASAARGGAASPVLLGAPT